MSMYQKLWDLK